MAKPKRIDDGTEYVTCIRLKHDVADIIKSFDLTGKRKLVRGIDNIARFLNTINYNVKNIEDNKNVNVGAKMNVIKKQRSRGRPKKKNR